MKKIFRNYKIRFSNLEDVERYSNYLFDKFKEKLFLNVRFNKSADIWEVDFKIELSYTYEYHELIGIWCDITPNELRGLGNEIVRQISQVYVEPQYFGMSFINS